MHNGFYEKTYYDIKKAKTSNNWRYGLFTSNGEMGLIETMSPDNDVIIYNNTKCVMDTVNPQETPYIYSFMDEIKRNVLLKNNVGNWCDKVKEYYKNKYNMDNYVSCGSRAYFPAGQLRIESKKSKIINYERAVNFESGEISSFVLADVKQVQKSFVSRKSGIAVSLINTDKTRDYTLSFDNIYEMGIDGKIKRECMPDITYEVNENNGELLLHGKFPINYIDNSIRNGKTKLSGATFAVVLKIITDGELSRFNEEYSFMADGRFFGREEGKKEEIKTVKKYLKIEKCNNIMILAKTDYSKSGKNVYDRLRNELNEYINKNNISPDTKIYNRMLKEHISLHKTMFNSVKLRLGSDEETKEEYVTNSELHRLQRIGENNEYQINDTWLNRLYSNSRYTVICSHGYSTARLGGIWIGNFMASWSGDHTVNANTNAQISGINTGNLPECAESYINFVLDHAIDWIKNAEKINGIKNALKAPSRMDGAGCGSFYSTPPGYPMIFWNAGAAWQLLPIFEYWECYGNRKILLRYDIELKSISELLDLSEERLSDSSRYLDLEQDILKPLITKLVNFWFGFVDERFYIDENKKMHINDGTVLNKNLNHRYIFVPGYSPENGFSEEVYNKPETVVANCTMDIAAAHDSIRMAKILCTKGIITEFSIEELESFYEHIPQYMYNEYGALKEWALDIYGDHDNHRHSSHLYPAWPGYEVSYDMKILNGIRQAIKARHLYAGSERTTGFGRMQLCMAAARIRDKELFRHCLYDLVGADFEYPSLMTSHDMGLHPGAFCTDNAASINGVINEALVYSDEGRIVLLPCSIWKNGRVSGIMTCCGFRIELLKWNENEVFVSLIPVAARNKAEVEYEGKIIIADIEKETKIKFTKTEHTDLKAEDICA